MNLVEQLLVAVSKERRRIVVIGDAMIDRWVHGKVEDCQDGCKKFIQQDVCETPGGAENAYRSLLYWDVNKSLYGQMNHHRPIKTRFVEGDRIVYRYDDETKIDPKEYKWCYEQALEMVSHAHGVLLSDYDKGFLTPEFMREVIDLCKRREIPCVADVKREPKLYEGAIIKGNAAWSLKYTEEKWWQTTRKWVVTNGHHQPTVSGKGYEQEVSGDILPEVRCVNHVGAGDCFAAHLTLALAYGLSLREAAAIAHSAGRVYVQHPHNRPPRPAEIIADMNLTAAN